MNKNIVIISIVSVLGTFIFLFVVYKLINQPVKTNFPQTSKLRADDHIRWSPEKKNILIEYSDFQCPSCKNVHDILKSIEASGSADIEVTKKVTLAYRYFPLYQIHDKANIAAYAAEAAGKQGKFWEMADLLFNNQQSWGNSKNAKQDYFLKYAQKLELNVDQFNKDINSVEVKNRVEKDLKEAEQMGISSTPTFFLNGQKIDVNSNDELIKKLKSL